MKKLFILCVLFMVMSVSPVFALTFSVYESGSSSIDTWINGGQVTVLEDFEGSGVDGTTMDWYQSLTTGIGTFTTEGSDSGTGATSYNANNNFSPDPYFSIQDRSGSWFGRYNTTDVPGASQWLDSGDINKLTLNVDPISLTNLFFYMQDPSDVGAVTTIGTNVNTIAYANFNGKQDGASYFVGITLEEGETLSQIIWSTTTVGDGYGLDDFSTVAPVPEPATMLLFGTGLAGLVSARLRRKKN